MSCSTHSTSKKSDTLTNLSSHKSGHFEVLPFFGKFQVHRTQFDNGLKLLVVEDHSSPTFAYHTWFRVGSRHEIPSQTGLAHLFEHMMFKGTVKFPNDTFDQMLERAGAVEENAFTSNDYTAYVQQLPSDKLRLIAELESDRMNNLVVNDASFKTEREVVQNERRYRKENSPEGTLYQILFETAFTQHPYHWPVIGYEEDLNAMSSENARDFFKKYYSPDRATITVVGDVDPEHVYDTISEFYAKIPAQNTPDHAIAPEPEQLAQRRKKIPLNIQVEKLWMAFKMPPIQSPEFPSIEVLGALLSDGKSGRLNKALVDTGICTSVSSGSRESPDTSLFLISANLQKGKKSSLAESVILSELQRLSKDKISMLELQKAKNILKYALLDRLGTHSEKANFLGLYETITPSMKDGMEIQTKIQSVTVEDIQHAAQKVFQPKALTLLIGVQK